MTTQQTLFARREAAIPRGVANLLPVMADRADNTELWDVDGRRYIDFASGIAVLNTGHRHPRVMAAVQQQMERFTHTCFHVAPYESYVALAERLNGVTPGSHAKKTMFATTGAEAVENAVKIARAATGRPAVIAFQGGFHGRTLLGMSLTGKVAPYKKGFGPFPADIFHAPYPYEYRGISTAQALAGLEALFASDVDPDRVAAIIVEPVQGEGGFVPAPAAFLQGLRTICDRHGILLVADEIQTGFARTGRMFAFEHAGIVPDLMTMAKSLAGGLPLSAVTGRAEIMDAPAAGGLGGTYGGNPLACAAALAVLDVIQEDGLIERATTIGARMQQHLTAMAARNRFSCIGDVRGLGAMVAIEFVHDRAGKQPAPEIAKGLVAEAARRGLMLLACGSYGNVIRLLSPLTVPDAVLAEGLDLLETSLETVLGA